MKKFISFLATIVLVFSISAICANAYYIPDNSKYCYIKSNQTYNYSDYVVGKVKYYGGQNTGSRKLNVIAQRYDSSKDKFVQDKKTTLSSNACVEMVKTSDLTASTSWRVYLEPSGIYTSGCTGNGYIWHT